MQPVKHNGKLLRTTHLHWLKDYAEIMGHQWYCSTLGRLQTASYLQRASAINGGSV